MHIEEGHDAFREDWIWLGAEKAVDLNSYMSVERALATCGVSGVGELCDDHADGRSSEGQGDEHEPEPLLSFTKVHVAYRTVKSLFMSTALMNVMNRTLELGISAVLS